MRKRKAYPETTWSPALYATPVCHAATPAQSTPPVEAEVVEVAALVVDEGWVVDVAGTLVVEGGSVVEVTGAVVVDDALELVEVSLSVELLEAASPEQALTEKSYKYNCMTLC